MQASAVIATSPRKPAHPSMPQKNMQTSNSPNMKYSSIFPFFNLSIFLSAFVLSCKSAKTVSSSHESEWNAVSQVQWQSTQNLSFSGLHRLTALYFDSCALYFPPTRNTSEHSDTSAPLPDVSPSTGKPHKNTKTKSSSFSTAQPSKITVYGLHLSQKVEEKSSMYQQEADSLAKAMQSSYAKAQNTQKESKPFLSSSTKLTFILLFIIGIILIMLRRSHARRK